MRREAYQLVCHRLAVKEAKRTGNPVDDVALFSTQQPGHIARGSPRVLPQLPEQPDPENPLVRRVAAYQLLAGGQELVFRRVADGGVQQVVDDPEFCSDFEILLTQQFVDEFRGYLHRREYLAMPPEEQQS